MNDINATILKDHEGSICIEGYMNKDRVVNVCAIYQSILNYIINTFEPDRVHEHIKIHIYGSIDKLFSLLVTDVSSFIEKRRVINITLDESVNEYFHNIASAIIDGYNENSVMKYIRFVGDTAERIERESKIISDKIKTEVLNIPTDECIEPKASKYITYPIPPKDKKYNYITIYNQGTDIYYCDGYMSYPIYAACTGKTLSTRLHPFQKMKVLIDFITNKVCDGGHVDLVRGLMSLSDKSDDYEWLYLLEYVLRRLNYDVKQIDDSKSNLLKRKNVYIHLTRDTTSSVINIFNNNKKIVSIHFNATENIIDPIIDALRDKNGKLLNTNLIVCKSDGASNVSYAYLLSALYEKIKWCSDTNTLEEGSVTTIDV